MTNEKEIKKNAIGIRSMTATALMAAVLCVIGPFSIPIGPIPLSLALVGIYLCAYTLGAKRGTLAVFIYILLGAVGLPVFTGFAGGPAKLFGPTGGYIAGYLLTAFICGIFTERFTKWYVQLAGMVLGLIACYTLGTLWFMFQAHVSFIEALATCVIPFVVFDLIKIALGMSLGMAIKKALTAAKLV